MAKENNHLEIPMREQLKKFAIKSMIGFQTVIVFGMGKQLGIFEYLYEKATSEKQEKEIKFLSFTIEELSKNLKLDMKYLDAWLHMALECGIFELDVSNERTVKTAPHVYDILINHQSMFYVGGTMDSFYRISLYNDILINGFKTGENVKVFDMPVEVNKGSQQASEKFGSLIERLFAKSCKEDRKKLLHGAKVLEVGCGYGNNLKTWAKNYPKANFIGIDIDPYGVNEAQKLIDKQNWNDRIKVKEISIEKFVDITDRRFDLIILNQVLHEMDPDENYRIATLNNIYTLLKNDGLLIIGESMIPDTFTVKNESLLFEVMHKWLEVGFESRFYDENSFRIFIQSTKFKNPELLKDRGTYFWAIRK